MSSASSLVSSPAATKTGRSARKGEVARGLDNLIDSTLNADVKYCAGVLEKDNELAAFCASMLRDGELQKALARKKQSSLKRKLGRQLPDRCKRFRGLPKKLCETAITTILGHDLFPEGGDEDEEEQPLDASGWKDPKAWCRVLAYGLRVNTELDLPKQHRFSKYEGPLLLVFQARTKEVNFDSRLKGITKGNFASFGNTW